MVTYLIIHAICGLIAMFQIAIGSGRKIAKSRGYNPKEPFWSEFLAYLFGFIGGPLTFLIFSLRMTEAYFARRL